MENRKYLRENAMTLKVHEIFGENTRVRLTWANQGPQKLNGQKFNRITVIIDYEDINLSMCSKFKDIYPDEALLVQYALDMMEDDSLEEYYKAVLLLNKQSLQKTIDATKKTIEKFEHGEYSWPINSTNIDEYHKNNGIYQKAIDSTSYTTDDLKYFAQYQREGSVLDSDKRFDY